MVNERRYTLMGQTLSIAGWARKYGIKKSTLRRRLVVKGMSLKEALFCKFRCRNVVTVNGKNYSVTELAKVMRVKPDLIYNRRSKGWKDNELVIKQRSHKKLSAFGKTLTAQEWANETGVELDTIQVRIRKGWSVEDAVSVKPISHGLSRQYNGLTAFGETKPLNQWAREYRISPSTIRRRLSLGFSVEMAIKLPTPHSKQKKEAS